MSKNDDLHRLHEFRRAMSRGDVWAMARLTSREWQEARSAWATSPLRHAAFGLVVAVVAAGLHAVTHVTWFALAAPLAVFWFGCRTLWAMAPSSGLVGRLLGPVGMIAVAAMIISLASYAA